MKVELLTVESFDLKNVQLSGFSSMSPFIFGQRPMCLEEREDSEVCDGETSGSSDHKPGGCMQGAFHKTAPHPVWCAIINGLVDVQLWYPPWLTGFIHNAKIQKTAFILVGRQTTHFGSYLRKLVKHIFKIWIVHHFFHNGHWKDFVFLSCNECRNLISTHCYSNPTRWPTHALATG